MKRYSINRKPYYGTRMQNEYVLTFDSYSEFINACHERKALGSKNFGFTVTGHSNFTGSENYTQAYKLASEGWKDGCKLMSLKIDKLDVKSHIKKPELFFDVSGDYGFDMGRVMSGEPEVIMNYRESDDMTESNHGPIVKMLVNTVMSGGIPVDIVMHRGAAIVSLVDALEQAGKRVQIDVICSAQLSDGLYTHQYPLKNADETLQIDQIAFCIAHPSIERRFNFIALDLFPTWLGHSYGGPVNVDPVGYDVYVPMLHYHDENWQTIETVNNWVIAELHKLGIKMENE